MKLYITTTTTANTGLFQGTFSELRSCVKVEVAVMGSPSLISLMVSVDVKHHTRKSPPARSALV